MSLHPGIHFGPYEILAPLGAGGMGEVWKARDTRLDRFVAVKVLPEHLANNPESLARFEREAKAVAALNHPNITGIHDFATQGDITYVVMELLEGESLRTRLESGPIAPRKATELAIQLAQGLAAAHEKGVVHRDLKPENLWITKEGRLKILDFGLAKLIQPVALGPDSIAQTAALGFGHQTSKGMILGTVGYMSPEQVKGDPVDARADLFSFGVVLYEMLTGRRAFAKDSAAETLAAILKEEPPDPVGFTKPIPLGLRRILDRCLEKSPANRFQSTRDLAFALEDALGSGSESGTQPVPLALRPIARVAWWAVLASCLVIGAALGWLGRGPQVQPTFRRLTYGKGTIDSARFVPGSREIMYSARWKGSEAEVFSLRPESPEPRSLGIQGAVLLAIAPSGELLVKDQPQLFSGYTLGALTRITPAGGRRVIAEGALDADWTPDGASLALTGPGIDRSAQKPLDRARRVTLEFPAGHPVQPAVKTAGLPSKIRVSPKGDRLVIFRPYNSTGGVGRLELVDRQGNQTHLADVKGLTGLAWGPPGDEIWFSENHEGSSAIWAIRTSGHKRLLLRHAGRLELLDVAPDGHALVALGLVIQGAVGMSPPDFRERDLTWNEANTVQDISPDGQRVLLCALGDWGNADGAGSVYLRTGNDAVPVRLGEGKEAHFMPNGQQALALSADPITRFQLLDLKQGQPRDCAMLKNWALEAFALPDNRRVVFSDSGRFSIFDLASGAVQPFAEVGATSFNGTHPVSPDGKWVVLATTGWKRIEGSLMLYSTEGASPVPVKGIEPSDIPMRWSGDSKALFVFNRDGFPTRIHRLDLATGKRTLVREITPSNPSGLDGIRSLVMTPDTHHLAYNYYRKLSDLYLIEGLK